jgi:hypothetical protein
MDYLTMLLIISEWYIRRNVKGTRCGLIWGTILAFRWINRKTHENPEDSQCPSPDSKQPPPKYNSEPLLVEWTCFVEVIHNSIEWLKVDSGYNQMRFHQKSPLYKKKPLMLFVVFHPALGKLQLCEIQFQ